MLKRFFTILIFVSLMLSESKGQQVADAARGLDFLLNKAYLPAAFDQESFDEVWKSWEEPLRSQAAESTPAQRRALAFERYGLIARKANPSQQPQLRPMQYVVDEAGNWTMNCLACHQGMVAGRMIPGAPNTQFALETLTHDIRAAKLRLGKRLTDIDIGSMIMPLGTTTGTTNAVMFGVALMHYRDADLNLHNYRLPPAMTHHDHDAPPWWNTSRKARLYSDNFAPRGHRGLMQFLASIKNGPEKFREWEDDFRHIKAYIDSLEPPRYPFAVDEQLAERGRAIFNKTCADCHGTYGQASEYPERIIPLAEIGTDPLRLKALSVKHRQNYEKNWINEYGRRGKVIADPGGYLAPPLDGIWASAPYFHNGSVPTLWHVLHSAERPVVWTRRQVHGFDQQQVGLPVSSLAEIPTSITDAAAKRHYFDTRKSGKSAAGHDFPEVLSEPEREAVLEYLKTL